MIAKSILIAAMLAYVEARFGQEQLPINAISQVKGGQPGQAQTVAGAAVSDLLGGANSCAKLQRADQIIQELGTGADAVAAAIGLVTAEKNSNPFANGNAQKVCGDATLPASQQLRGITPLIDPAANGSAQVNALSAQTAKAPADATGKSIFDLINDAGFGGSVVAEQAAGNAAANAGGNANANQNANANKGNANQNANANSGNANQAADECADGANAAAASNANQAAANNTASANAGNNAAAGNQAASGNQAAAASSGNIQKSTIAGLDFGTCIPTIIFEGGLGNRPPTEFTFQLADKVAAQGQEEALNPNIITNRVCDQLTNVCNANAAAKTACTAAKAKIQALGTRDKSTADAWNTELGFAGFVTNPDGGAADAPAKAGAAVRARRFRS